MRMVESFNQFNVDKIPLIVALQNSDFVAMGGGRNMQNNDKNINKQDSLSPQMSAILERFKQVESPYIRVMFDTDFALPYLITQKLPSHNLSVGYINQEIAKLTFFTSNIAEHYLCVDSDTIFIRDFRKNDFFYDDDTPYIVLVEDKELYSKPYYRHFGEHRKKFVKKIFDFMELDDRRLRTCHNSQIFSSRILRHLQDNFLLSRHLKWSDLLDISPFEFSWYNAYFQKVSLIKEAQIEPLFKIYHTNVEYILDKLVGQNLKSLSSQYIGVIFNSNWASCGDKVFKKQGIFARILVFLLKKFWS